MITLGELASGLGARVRGDAALPATLPILGLRQDSRAIRPGELFAVRTGARTDGWLHVADAVARGAVALLASRPPAGAPPRADLPLPVIEVDDVAAAIGPAASLVYGDPTAVLRVIGVTGTNGKTTVTYLVQAALARIGARPGVLGTLGARFGDHALEGAHTTPEADEVMRVAAWMRELGATHLAMEVSSHALSLHRVDGVRFAAAGFTNLTPDHLDFHGSMTAYGEAKARLFGELAPGAAVLNVDDPFVRELAERAPRGRRLRVSPTGAHEAEIRTVGREVGPAGIDARLATPDGEVAIRSPLLGEHNLANLAVALGLAMGVGARAADAAEALSGPIAVPGRLERCDGPGDDVTVLVDFAHTPDALERVLATVRKLTRGRVWCVFGCGGDRDATKRAPMGAAVAAAADVPVVTSDNPRTEPPLAIIEQILAGIPTGRATVEPDRARAIELAVADAAPGDLVLVAGKGHETYQILGATKHPFSDVEQARAALARRRAR